MNTCAWVILYISDARCSKTTTQVDSEIWLVSGHKLPVDCWYFEGNPWKPLTLQLLWCWSLQFTDICAPSQLSFLSWGLAFLSVKTIRSSDWCILDEEKHRCEATANYYDQGSKQCWYHSYLINRKGSYTFGIELLGCCITRRCTKMWLWPNPKPCSTSFTGSVHLIRCSTNSSSLVATGCWSDIYAVQTPARNLKPVIFWCFLRLMLLNVGHL